MPAVVLTRDEHNVVTAMLKEALPYNRRHSAATIIRKHAEVYQKLHKPVWAQRAIKFLKDNPPPQ
jgi:hypothetical protein